MAAHKPYILLVEDDADLRDMLTYALSETGMEVVTAGEVDEAWRIIGDGLPSLVLLDWMLPGISGIEFLRRLRRDPVTQTVPVIMLTAKTDEADRVRGLDTGADDYIAKPFSVRELKSRISAVLRRAAPEATESIVLAGNLKLDPASHRVLSDEEEIMLGPTEFRLLHFMMTHKDRVYSRRQLLDRVWGTNVYVEERTVDVHIRRLRKALEPHNLQEMIQTVRGAGYRFSE